MHANHYRSVTDRIIKVGKNINTLLIFISLCKKHYLDWVSNRVRKEMKIVYRDPESNYSAMDFLGTGLISMQTFITNIIVKRLKIEEEDLK